MYISVNGKIIKKEEAVISAYDHGYLYGLGLFETFRIYNGHPFLLDDHLARLQDGLQQLNVHYHISKKDILQTIKQLLEANQLQDAYVRLNISAGVGDIGLQVERYEAPTIIIYMKPLANHLMKNNEKNAVFLKTVRNTPEGIYRLKSHHYLNNIIGKRELQNPDNTEGIFFTKEGYVAEGIVSNLFWVKQNKVYTPHLDTGILNGITRNFIIKLLKDEFGIEVSEGFYSKDELLQCDESFFTNSIQEVVPIKKMQNKLLPGKDGSFTAQLLKAYKAHTKAYNN